MASTAMRTCQWSGDAMITRIERLIEHFTVIHVCACGAVRPLLYSLAPWAIDVAHCGKLIIAGFVGCIEEVIHAAAGADHSDAKCIVGAKNASGSESG